MSYAAKSEMPDRVTLGTQHLYAMELRAFGGGTQPASAAWPAANLAIYVPIYVHSAIIVTEMWWVNGAVVTGSTTVDMALYDEAGTSRLIHGGGVTQATINVPQGFDVTDTLVVPGRYWLGLVASNNTTEFRRWTGGTGTQYPQKMLGMLQEALGSAAMPTATTFAVNTNSYIPLIGISQGVTVL